MLLIFLVTVSNASLSTVFTKSFSPPQHLNVGMRQSRSLHIFSLQPSFSLNTIFFFFFLLSSLCFQPVLFHQCSLSNTCNFQKYVESNHFLLSPLPLSRLSSISRLDYWNNSQLICLLSALSSSRCKQFSIVVNLSKHQQSHVICFLDIFQIFSLSQTEDQNPLIVLQGPGGPWLLLLL